MKHLRETFTEEEFARLKKAKGKTTWHAFIMRLAAKEEPQNDAENHL
jgi:hypothetical protein